MASKRPWLTIVMCWALAAAAPAQQFGPRIQFDAADSDPIRFSYQLLEFVSSIQQQYVHEVGRTDLLEAALNGLCAAAGQTPPDGLRAELDRGTLAEILRTTEKVRKNLGHHEAVAGPKALIVCAKSMVKVLDPHCGIVENNYRTLAADNDGVARGTGVEFVNAPPMVTLELPVRPRLSPAPKLPNALQIQTVIPGSPAQRAGLRPGDRLLRINDQTLGAIDSALFTAIFHTGDANLHTLTIERPGRAAPFTVSLAAEAYVPEGVFGVSRTSDGTWDHILDRVNKVGYIRLGAIETQTDAQFLRALDDLQAVRAKGLILDLRWCPGGFLKVAVRIAKGLLNPELLIAAQQGRTGTVPELTESQGPPVLDLPVVVLVNGATSGGGELIAAALQDHKRAIIAGDRTVGKASVQQLLNRNPLESVQFRISTALLIRPSEKNMQRRADSSPADDWGVRPDAGRWLPLSPAVANQLKEWWTWQALRPAGDKTALPTDDLEADPQLKAALHMLRKRAGN